MAENDTLNPDGTQKADASADGGNTDAADAAATGSGAGSEDVSLLSRFRGQTAKVGELTGKVTAAEARAQAAEQKLAEYEAGKLGADDALKAQLQAEKDKTAAAEASARAARIEAKFPETFAELGEDGVVGLPDEKLAALEARLKGEAAEKEPPTPGRHNESRTSTATTSQKREETADDIEARLLSMPNPYAR